MKTTHFNGRAIRLAIASTLAAGSIAFAVNSHADKDTANLEVTASISPHCAISTVPASSGGVTTTCIDGAAIAVSVDREASVTEADSANAPVGVVVSTVMY